MTFLLSVLAGLTMITNSISLVKPIKNTQIQTNITATSTNDATTRYAYPIFGKKEIVHNFKVDLNNAVIKQFPNLATESISIIRILAIPGIEHPYLYVVLTSAWSQNGANYQINKDHEMDMWGYNVTAANQGASAFTFLNQVSAGMAEHTSYFDDIQNTNLQILKAASYNNKETWMLTFNYRPVTMDLAAQMKTDPKLSVFFAISNNQFLKNYVPGVQIKRPVINHDSILGNPNPTIPDWNYMYDNSTDYNSSLKGIEHNDIDGSLFSSSYNKNGNPSLVFFINNNNSYGGTPSLLATQGLRLRYNFSGYGDKSNSNSASLQYLWFENDGDISDHPTSLFYYNLSKNNNRLNLGSWDKHPTWNTLITSQNSSPTDADPNAVWYLAWHTGYARVTYEKLRVTNLKDILERTDNPFVDFWHQVNLDGYIKNLNSVELKTVGTGKNKLNYVYGNWVENNYASIFADNELNAGITDEHTTNMNNSEINTTGLFDKKLTGVAVWDDNPINNYNSINGKIDVVINNSIYQLEQPNPKDKIKVTFQAPLANNIIANNVLSFYKSDNTIQLSPTKTSVNYFMTYSSKLGNYFTYEISVKKDTVQHSTNISMTQLVNSSNPLLGTMINVPTKTATNITRPVQLFLTYDYAPLSSTSRPANILETDTILQSAFVYQFEMWDEKLDPKFKVNWAFTNYIDISYFKVFKNFFDNLNTLPISKDTFAIEDGTIKNIANVLTKVYLKNNNSILSRKNSIINNNSVIGLNDSTLFENMEVLMDNAFVSGTTTFNVNTGLGINQYSIDHNIYDLFGYILPPDINVATELVNSFWTGNQNIISDLPDLIKTSPYKSYADELNGSGSSNPESLKVIDNIVTSNYNFDELILAANMANFVAYFRDNMRGVDTKGATLSDILLNMSKYDSDFNKNENVLKMNSLKEITLNNDLITNGKASIFNASSMFSFTNHVINHFEWKAGVARLVVIIVPTIAGVLIITTLSVVFLPLLKRKQDFKKGTKF